MSDKSNAGDAGPPPHLFFGQEDASGRDFDPPLDLVEVMDHISDAFIAVDATWRVVFWNRRAEQIHHIPRSAALGRQLWEVLPDLRGTRLGEKLNSAMKSRSSASMRAPALASGRWYHARIQPAPQGWLTLFFKELEPGEDRAGRELPDLDRETLSGPAELADNMPQLAWMADANGNRFWYNRRWLQYTGATLDEVKGWDWTKECHPDHVQRVAESFRRCSQTGEAWEEIFPLRGNDGSYCWFLSRAEPVCDSEGRITRWFGTDTDITEQRKLERSLVRADRVKNEFLATLAHELRNPLAPLRNGLQILMAEECDGPNRQRVQQMMARQLKIMVRQIDELLDISRISLGRFQLEKRVHSVAEIVNNAIETSLTLIDEKNHTLRASIPEEPVFVNADLMRLGQVVSNLLNNAAKYTKSGGHIEVEVSAHGDTATITVSDNGKGLDASQLKGIFNKFWRAEDTIEFSNSGLGLGLSIAKSLVEMHDGAIEASSPGIGLGSVFRITLPRAEEPPAERSPSEPARSSRADPAKLERTVLVVDDNEDAAKTMAMMIRLYGAQTHIAHDGQDAVEKAEAFKPDLILLDLGMPGMNGYEACRCLRKGALGSSVKIVALTGWGQDTDKRRSMEAGFDQHLTKPVEPDEILRLIQEL